MKSLRVKATIIMGFIHVLEYLWKAGWCFFKKVDPKVEKWIAINALKILNGKCNQIAKGIRIKGTKNKIEKREAVDILLTIDWMQQEPQRSRSYFKIAIT